MTVIEMLAPKRVVSLSFAHFIREGGYQDAFTGAEYPKDLDPEYFQAYGDGYIEGLRAKNEAILDSIIEDYDSGCVSWHEACDICRPLDVDFQTLYVNQMS